MTESSASEQFVLTLGRGIVTELAPEELALFEPISQAYLHDPRKVLADRGRPGAVLGSGIDTAVLVLSPVALAVATSIYEHLVDKAGELAVTKAGGLLKRLRRKKTEDQPVPELTPELCEEASEQARQAVEKLTKDPALAGKVAEVVRILLDQGR
ncbi:hypothetical protein GCM10010174_01840 [Kutzneria viridogrisea]|uniref:Uncharacterized protein n=2 Tax=Kutzneria TaxID=43356 RepID=W5WAE7_9PSEU|nr:hypothetical protein [Kutzneria albida]AHH97710.1 hypothetical protein KALB_4348 [Kutzneria albida DSM 43870]MBA8924702.1 hypothetical protein [Kutzneria viridogrisea]